MELKRGLYYVEEATGASWLRLPPFRGKMAADKMNGYGTEEQAWKAAKRCAKWCVKHEVTALFRVGKIDQSSPPGFSGD